MRCPSRDASRSSATIVVAASNCRRRHEAPRLLIGGDQLRDLGPQGGIAGTRLIEEARSRVPFALQARFDELLGLFPLLRRHLEQLFFTSRYNQARATLQSRLTVFGDDAQRFCRFFHGQPAKKSQFDDAALPRIELGQALERLVQGQELVGLLLGQQQRFFEWYPLQSTLALRGPAGPGVINQHAAHHLRGDANEVRPVLPGSLGLIDQTKVRLVDQRSRLQRMVGSFAPHLSHEPTGGALRTPGA